MSRFLKKVLIGLLEQRQRYHAAQEHHHYHEHHEHHSSRGLALQERERLWLDLDDSPKVELIGEQTLPSGLRFFKHFTLVGYRYRLPALRAGLGL